MSKTFAVLYKKAELDIESYHELSKKSRLHDNAGRLLHSATEKLFKSYLELCNVETYPKNGKNGHDLRLLLQMLEETDFPVSDFSSLIRLQLYDSASGYDFVDEEKQLNLSKYDPIVELLKGVVYRKYDSMRRK